MCVCDECVYVIITRLMKTLGASMLPLILSDNTFPSCSLTLNNDSKIISSQKQTCTVNLTVSPAGTYPLSG